MIREATVDDAPALAVLSGELGYPADAQTIARRLRETHGRAAAALLVAVDAQGKVCGFAHAEPRRLLTAEPFVELAALVVGASARGQGVGAALLRAVEAWAREQGFACVRVRSNIVRVRAHDFYLHEGYAERKRQAVFFKDLHARSGA